MIIVILCRDNDSESRTYGENIISHGYDPYTGRSIVLPAISLHEASAVWDDVIGEYIIN